MRHSPRKQAWKLLLVLLGNGLIALAVTAFIAPSGFIMGGATGLGLFLEKSFGISVSITVAALNGLLFITGLCFLGKGFALSTVVSSVAYPIFLTVFQGIEGLCGLSESPVICMVYGGVLVGAGVGLILRQGASTGGTDIPPLIFYKKWGIPVSLSLNAIDLLILLLQVSSTDTDRVLYGIMTVFLYTTVLGKVLTLGKSQTEVKIISEKHEELNEAIQQRLQRGTTLLAGEGGHSGERRPVIFSIMSNRELVRLKEIAEEIDPKAFFIAGNVSEVSGLGFTIEKPRD